MWNLHKNVSSAHEDWDQMMKLRINYGLQGKTIFIIHINKEALQQV